MLLRVVELIGKTGFAGFRPPWAHFWDVKKFRGGGFRMFRGGCEVSVEDDLYIKLLCDAAPPSQKAGKNGQCLTYVAMLIHKFTGRLAS